MVVGMMMGWGVSEQGWRKGPWTPEEDKLLTEYINLYGEGRWSSVARSAGLKRNGKSCRLRWVNYLRPGLIKGHLTPQEEGIIIELHALWGNKWSTIARYLPGRTDNEIKNFWRTHFKKKSNPSEKKGKRKLIKRQNQQENGTGSATVISPESQSEVICDQNFFEQQGLLQNQNEMQSTYSNIENPGLPGLYQESSSSLWSESIPTGGLWGWLWNFDDQNVSNLEQANCDGSKMAKQNQATLAPQCFGFDKGCADAMMQHQNEAYIS